MARDILLDLMNMSDLSDLSALPLEDLQAAYDSLSVMNNGCAANNIPLPDDLAKVAYAVGDELARRRK